ncbi:hypothetical protein [Vibrio nitrifigilis]|uniref:Uncharacterized protein n=1 Tax=Vibrio nitrifigilis TaxID=2789781 RepID=A0ABS0GJS7_9VIBR|nr:hypothetical protein [Vibrio nitrifigilis]MBF9002696.1 hypothetical protein [Vibrio nitrifigilis]
MKIFSISTLVIQFILICWSKYYGFLADDKIHNLKIINDNDVVEVAELFQHYNHLENNMAYAAGAVWLMVIIVINVKKVANTRYSQLTIYSPIVLSLILEFF